MFTKRFTIFKLLGFEVKIDPSWLILAVLVTWSLAVGLFPGIIQGLPQEYYWWMGIAGTVGLLFSIIFHELSHSVVARRLGLPMKGITLFIFGGVAEMEKQPESPRVRSLNGDSGTDLKRGPVNTMLWGVFPGVGKRLAADRLCCFLLPWVPESCFGGVQHDPGFSSRRRTGA